KHVLCEKPLALTSADAARMVEACELAGVRLMEAFMYRLHPSWQALRDLVGSGPIGSLLAVHSWFSYFNDQPTNIRNIHEASGGPLYRRGGCVCECDRRRPADAHPARRRRRQPAGDRGDLRSGRARRGSRFTRDPRSGRRRGHVNTGVRAGLRRRPAHVAVVATAVLGAAAVAVGIAGAAGLRLGGPAPAGPTPRFVDETASSALAFTYDGAVELSVGGG